MSSILWSKFNPARYIQTNYSYIHEEDKQIIQLLLNYYSHIPQLQRALEIGVGPNLYPVMAMLPFINKINCVDYSKTNIAYLKQQIIALDDNWNLFWKLFKQYHPQYHNIDLLDCLKQKVKIHHGSIYQLNKEKYDLSSMFFCAESITSNYQQFDFACKKFILSVKHGVFLLAAFMENSKEYTIDSITFPAYPITSDILNQTFSESVINMNIHHIPIAKKPLRSGYTGMLFLTATRI